MIAISTYRNGEALRVLAFPPIYATPNHDDRGGKTRSHTPAVSLFYNPHPMIISAWAAYFHPTGFTCDINDD